MAQLESPVMLADYEVPVARSMIMRATQLHGEAHPLDRFTCYWVAFNNIYVTIAEKQGRGPQLRTNPDGSIRMRTVSGVQVPEVSPVTERQQLDLVFRMFAEELKRALVEDPSTRFFVYRTPRWRGKPIERDANGQRLNGVLNVGYTVCAQYPVWAPLDVRMYEEYQAGARDTSRCDALARQILDILYTVRNNAFHGGKRTDDANDQEVLEKALPLLAMIVRSFVHVREAA